jgi:hypothetical protein
MPARRHVPRRRSRRRPVARPERVCGVHPSGYGSGRAWPGRPAGPMTGSCRTRGGAGVIGSGTRRAAPTTPPAVSQLFVRGVDHRHAPGRRPSRGRIGAADIRVVFAGEPSPGCLDRRLAGAALYSKDVVGIAARHVLSLPGALVQRPRRPSGPRRTRAPPSPTPITHKSDPRHRTPGVPGPVAGRDGTPGVRIAGPV